MPAFHGKEGAVTIGGVAQLNVTSWSLDINADVVDVTSMTNTSDYKERVVGFKDWSATVEAFTDDTTLTPALSLLGTTVTLILNDLTGTGGLLFTATSGALVTNISPATDANGPATMSVTLVANNVTPTLVISGT